MKSRSERSPAHLGSILPCASDLTERGWEPTLLEELARRFPGTAHRILAPGWVVADDDALDLAAPPPVVAFGRQWLPGATPFEGASLSKFAARAAALAAAGLGAHVGGVRLHVFRADDAGRHGRADSVRRAMLALLRRSRRAVMRGLVEDDSLRFGADEALVQVALLEREHGLVSVALPPVRHHLRRCLSPFAGGVAPVARDPRPPSRAYGKLLEAELHMTARIARGERCVDLGASPGGWTFVALDRGAHVVAIDRSALREDLMANPRLDFREGDAFRFRPDAPVDWLLCDVAAFPARILELLEAWVGGRLCRRFVVTVKFRGSEDYPILDELATRLGELGAEFSLRRLLANKNEVTAWGEVPV